MHSITLKTILNRTYKFKGFCYEKVGFDTWVEEVLVASIKPRQGSPGRCSGCQQKGPTYDHLPRRDWRFVPLWGFLVYLRYAQRRINCPQCGVKVEEVPWATGKHRMADALRLFLAFWARKLSWREVAETFWVSWADVYDSVKWVVDYGLKHRVLEGIRAIGVDEIQVRKGKHFWTLVYQIDQGARRLLWVGRDRTAKTFEGFMEAMGPQVCGGIEFVCSDLWQPYLKVVRQRLAQALHILDRFHIRQRQNQAVDEIRREEHRAMAGAGLKPRLKTMRWTLLKRRQNWSRKEKRRMRSLQNSNLRSIRAFLLVEAFQHFWGYWSPTWAGKFLDGWCRRVARSRLEPLKRMARTLREHRELLLNYFRARKEYSGGVIEGLNNKVKLTVRKSYGFKTDHAREVALFHALGQLPEPELTHRFF